MAGGLDRILGGAGNAEAKPADIVVYCQWCGEKFHRSHDRRSFCSKSCGKHYSRHGCKSRAEVEAVDLKNRPPQPKGCATVEEFLAAGGYVFRMPKAGEA